jgi:hypothetical protein
VAAFGGKFTQLQNAAAVRYAIERFPQSKRMRYLGIKN